VPEARKKIAAPTGGGRGRRRSRGAPVIPEFAEANIRDPVTSPRICAISQAMTSQIDRITINPDVCNGKPVVRGLRITVESILDYLSAGETREEILRQHPMLEPEDISACLAFASRLMAHKYSVKETA
jgi:uncharacterized protein (DUF433 family)